MNDLTSGSPTLNLELQAIISLFIFLMKQGLPRLLIEDGSSLLPWCLSITNISRGGKWVNDKVCKVTIATHSCLLQLLLLVTILAIASI